MGVQTNKELLMNATNIPETPKLLSFKQLKDMGLPWSREHIWRLESAERFPRRLELSPQRVAWLEDEVIAFIEAKADERTAREYRLHD
jgi:prophage regulatory protein